jgi:nucleoside-diphosphate-sugar epimerase
VTHSHTVLVTGAAGYLASWIVQQLLEQGQTVHGTVRSLRDAAKVQHLLNLASQHPGRLQLFEADLLQDGSFDTAMQGCSLVVHAASPYFLATPKDVQKELIQPAVHGTQNVLASANRTASVRRVVVTSSIAALYNDACDVGASAHHTVQEHDINPNQDIAHNPYAYSKTLAVHTAWEMQAQQQRWELVAIHPGAIFGPSLSRRVDASSVSMVLQFLRGAFRTGVPRLWLGVVDVRDAAQAHVQAALRPNVHGRYVVVAHSLRLLEMAQCMELQGLGIVDKLPRSEAPKWLMWLIGPLVGMQRDYVARNVGHPVYFNSARSQAELGLQWRTAADTLNDQIRQIARDGLLLGSP